MDRIMTNRPDRCFQRYQKEFEEAALRVLRSGRYILGEELENFEKAFAEWLGVRYCVGVGNGLDALTLAIRACGIGEGDEVIVPANTYIASILAITQNGLVPVLVEPREDMLEIDPDRIESHITNRTRSLMIVHLYGRCAYSEKIGDLCRKYNLLLVEDNAQAHGCRWNGRRTGSLGFAAGHSFYPGKNLGALGDAGAVTTDDDALAAAVRAIANYGSSRKYVFDYCGRNSRLDEIQAAVLSVKLKYLDAENERRRAIARMYYSQIRNPRIHWPAVLPDEQNVFHLFPVLAEERDRLQQFLQENGIQTLIHYPIPPHKQACYRAWNGRSLPVTEKIHAQELSLPIGPAMTDADVETVIDALNRFGR